MNIQKYVVFALLSLFIFQCSCNKEPDTQIVEGPFAVDIGNSKIPYIIINTNNAVIQNEPKIKATLEIYDQKKLVQTQSIGIEYKGKTSYRLSNKKPFSIECWDAAGADTKASFFGFPEEEDWLLSTNIVNISDKFIHDRTMLYNHIAYEMSRSIGRYAARSKFVELELNGEYLGLYTFTEKLKQNKNRIAIQAINAPNADNTGGYIITIDKASLGKEGIGKPLSYFNDNWQDDAKYTSTNSFRSNYDINRNLITFDPFGPPYHNNKYLESYFLYEYPSQDNITTDQKEYIQKYIYDFETALLNDNFELNERTYTDYIDVASFVDYFLLNELCRNVDAYRLSTYLQKDHNGKLAMGPLWDMNIGFDEGGRIPMDDWVINYNNHVTGDPWSMIFWWPRLMEDIAFKTTVKERWTSIRASQLSNSNLAKLVDDNANYLKENGAITRNYAKWDKGIGVNYDGSILSLKSFLMNRANWMDNKISQF